MNFEKLNSINSHYQLTSILKFPSKYFSEFIEEELLLALRFAYKMAFGKGHHRNKRSGGKFKRKAGEIFANSFQGKLAEIAVRNELVKLNYRVGEIDWSVHGEGIWDEVDLKLENIKINIKSAKYFSNLLLLEKKDWNKKGQYIPNLALNNKGEYDVFIFVRIKPSFEEICKSKRILYSETITKDVAIEVKDTVFKYSWLYDIPGHIKISDLINIIRSGENIIHRGSYLGQRTKMDATNYYVQSGNLRDLNTI